MLCGYGYFTELNGMAVCKRSETVLRLAQELEIVAPGGVLEVTSIQKRGGSYPSWVDIFVD